MEKAVVFFDGAYLQKVLFEEYEKARIDYAMLANALVRQTGAHLLRAYYYDCLPYQGNPPTEVERKRVSATQRFFKALSRLPRFQVKLGKLSLRGKDEAGRPVFEQKKVDIMIGVDMVEFAAARQISQAILFAGDSDFVPAVEAVKRQGVLTILWHGSMESVHRELWESCDERYQLSLEIINSIRR